MFAFIPNSAQKKWSGPSRFGLCLLSTASCCCSLERAALFELGSSPAFLSCAGATRWQDCSTEAAGRQCSCSFLHRGRNCGELFVYCHKCFDNWKDFTCMCLIPAPYFLYIRLICSGSRLLLFREEGEMESRIRNPSQVPALIRPREAHYRGCEGCCFCPYFTLFCQGIASRNMQSVQSSCSTPVIGVN